MSSSTGIPPHGDQGAWDRRLTWRGLICAGILGASQSQPATALLCPTFSDIHWPRDPMRSTLETRNTPKREGHNPSPHLAPPPIHPRTKTKHRRDPTCSLDQQGRSKGKRSMPTRVNALWEGRDGSESTLHPIPLGNANANVWANKKVAAPAFFAAYS